MASGTLTADGTGAWVRIEGGNALVNVYDDFDGGNAKLQMLADDEVTAVDVDGAVWSAPTQKNVSFGASVWARIKLDGATDPNLEWEIRPARGDQGVF